MMRMQVWLDKETDDALREKAHREHKSISAVARDILGTHLHTKTPGNKPSRLSFIGSGSSGRTDISVRHDEALGDDFR